MFSSMVPFRIEKEEKKMTNKKQHKEKAHSAKRLQPNLTDDKAQED